MRWNVEGTDVNGRSQIYTVEAASAEEAKKKVALAKSVTVGDVFRSSIKTEAERRDEEVARSLRDPLPAVVQPAPVSPPAPPEVVMDYPSLRFAAKATDVVGTVLIVLGMVTFAAGGLLFFAIAFAPPTSRPNELAAGAAIGNGVVSIVTGFLFRLFAQIGLAVRDIAMRR